MTVRIIHPPQFEPFQAYLSGPYLKGLLRHHGVEASVCDANISFYRWLIAKKGPGGMASAGRLAETSYLVQNVDLALTEIRGRTESLGGYRWGINVLDQYLGNTGTPDVHVGLSRMEVGNRYSSSDIKGFADKPDNLLAQYFDQAAEEVLGDGGVDTYLLSLVVIDQLAAAVVFAREIKRRRTRARVFIGGPLVSRLHRQISAVPWLAETFDAVVPGEAYRVLPPLLGLSDRYRGHVTPDFSDLDLERYWSCRKVLPYLVAHGCRWGACTFCSHHLTYDGYRASQMTEVLDDLERLSSRHGVEYISFSDEYLTLEQIDSLCIGLLERGLKLKWSTFARMEPLYADPEFAKMLYAAGCRMLMFGLESASQRVLNAMKKGTDVTQFRPILEACKEAKIAVRYDFMVGFPGETERDISKTYDFLCENRDVIDTPFSSYAVAVFELRSGIPVLENANDYRVLPRDPLRGDLDDQYEFESEGGLDLAARIAWRERFIRFSKQELGIEMIAPQNKTHQLVLKDLHDKGQFPLPILRVDPDDFAKVRARLARGVVLRRHSGSGPRVVNLASGGEVAVAVDMAGVLTRMEEGALLAESFAAQSLCDSIRFASFVNFLYRSDYIELNRVAQASPVGVVATSAQSV